MFQRIASTGSLARDPGPLGTLVPAEAGGGRPAHHIAAGWLAMALRARVEATDAWSEEAWAAADEVDPMAQMAQADAADASLMRLVLCAASTTLVLALISSLI